MVLHKRKSFIFYSLRYRRLGIFAEMRTNNWLGLHFDGKVHTRMVPKVRCQAMRTWHGKPPCSCWFRTKIRIAVEMNLSNPLGD